MNLFIRFWIIAIIVIELLASCTWGCEGKEYRFRVRLEIGPSTYKDALELKYLTEDSIELKVNQILIESPQNQFLEFCLTEEPIDLQFNFSKNSNNKSINILSALLENKEKQMFINADEFHQYFIGNRYVKYNKDNRFYEFSRDPNQKPYLKSRKLMNKRLVNKLTY